MKEQRVFLREREKREEKGLTFLELEREISKKRRKRYPPQTAPYRKI